MAGAPTVGFGQSDQQVFGQADQQLSASQWIESLMPDTAGAPWAVRQAVGGAVTPQDRLATLRQTYPDAQPYGADNFTFIDPKTKRRTYYNPPGADFGDVASVQPEMFEAAGGVVGGTLATPAALAQAPFTGGASMLEIPLGVGLGAAGGKELENIAMVGLGRRVDTRGALDRLRDASVTAGANAVGQRATDAAATGLRSLLGATPRQAIGGLQSANPQEILSAFERQGVRAPAGAVSGGAGLQALEKMTLYSPGGSSVMARAGQESIDQMAAALRRQVNAVGSGATKAETGAMMSHKAQLAAQTFAKRREALDQALEQTIGANTMAPVDNIIKLRYALEKELRTAPSARRPEFSSAIKELDNIIRDSGLLTPGMNNAGHLQFGALRKIRTRIGAELEAPDATGQRVAGQSAMARVYGALAEDIKRAAQLAGPKAQKALALHDRYVRFNRNVNLPVLQDLLNKDMPGQAFNWVMSGSRDDGLKLLQLRRSLLPKPNSPDRQPWDEVVSTVLAGLGRAKPGARSATGMEPISLDLMGPEDSFSPSTFLTNLRALSPEAKQAIFAGTRYRGLREPLQDLSVIAQSLRNAEAATNWSGTGRVMLYGNLLSAIGLGFASPTAAMGQAGAFVVAPYASAKLLTSPKFVRWLVDGYRISRTGGSAAAQNSLSRHLGRLAAIGAAEPELRDFVQQYEDALRSSIGPPQTQQQQNGAPAFAATTPQAQ